MMNNFCPNGRRFHAARIFVALSVAVSAHLAHAQPARLGPSQLDQLVSRISLYSDPLLAQVLAASSYWNQIPEAATWAQQHSYLTGDPLAQAIRQDNLDWDPSVIALLPFPSVLQMMAQDPAWTQQLGQAVLTQRADVMDAVQRMRKKAKDLGYLQSNNYMTVNEDQGYIEILPAAAGVIYVPTYDPLVVFAHPAHGLVIGGAITFGAGITIGGWFDPWGWASPRLLWATHAIVIDRPWVRGWVGREAYAHPYSHPWVRAIGPRVEHHDIHRR